MRLKKCLSGILAFAMVLNTGGMEAFASGDVQPYAANTQTESEQETVYVNSYGAGERSVSFNDHWRFFLGDASGAEAVAYNDSAWDNVTLPHDYSIDQGFTTAAPAEQESGYVLGGTGWYRKSFTLSEELKGKQVSIDFDGVYMNATVYLNGKQLGTHPYGYSPFSFELPADSLYYGGQENVLAVKVDHKQPSSRWYSGSGIYRDVKLTVTDPVHIAHYGTQVTTPDIAQGKGTVKIETTVQNDGEGEASVSVTQTVYEKGSQEPVATGDKTQEETVAPGASVNIPSIVTVQDPKLWSTTSPNLYTVRTEVYVGEELADSYDTEFGFRWVEVTKDNGFFLNGENIKLQGVCMHHDQGALGSEAWERSIERQVQMLKKMGVNAIRVTHNPAAQVLIDICNREGMMLVEEIFDSWLSGKAGNTEDYGKWFDQSIEAGNQIVGGEEGEKWGEFDLKSTILRGRNNPSIIMWSLGNEVFQQTIDTSRQWEYPDVAKNLIRWTAEVDNTRYVTFGDNWFKGNEGNSGNVATQTAKVIASASDYGLPGGLPGYNYGGSWQIQNGHNQGWLVYGSETASSTNSRGVYDRKDSNSDGNVGDRRLTSYDKSNVSWGHRASDALWITMQQPFNSGEFVWTGFDYIGEPTPYNWQGTGSNGTWPNVSKSSYFGIIDTAGIPKDSYYLYQSQWNEELNTLHVLPVWNEDEIMIDSNGNVEVVVYSDAPVVKLYLNGREVGTATTRTDTPTGGYQNYTSGTGCFDSSLASGHTSLYATFWVPYEEGKLEAKAFEADGITPITDTDGRSYVETTGNATKLQAKADRDTITADGKDLSYVTIDVTDTDGRLVNGAEPEITVSVDGDGKLLALDNGIQNDVTTYTEPTRKAGKGKLVAIVQSTREAGSFTVTATAPGYATATETIITTEAPDSGETTEKTVVSYTISRNYYVKQGEKPVLPEEVTVHYSDDTSETKKVTWDELPEGQDAYTLYGTLADVNLRVSVNVTMIGEVADVLNYSAAIGQDASLSLPEMRPAVLADGTVLAAEFPVEWEIPENVTANLGTVEVKGTASVFDQTFDVTASVRVTNGSYYEGDEALPNVPEMYIGGVSSKTDSSIAQVLTKLKDDKATKDDVAWSGRNTLDFRLDTAIDLQDFTLYLKDTAPTSDTIKVYASSNNGASWNPVDCKVTNQRGDGVTIRTYTPTETVSETWFRLEFTKQATLVELEMNTRIPTFPVGSEAALSYLKVGGYIASSAVLEKGSYNVPDTELSVEDITAEGKDNASVTILDKDRENVIRILLESEDHSQRGIFSVRLGKEDTTSDDPNDSSMDYPYADMTLRAPSVEEGGSVSWANDNDSNTIWHTNWGGGTGPTDLTNDPENRYLEIELPSMTRVDGLRYLPRNKDQNGIVTEYDIKVSKDGQDWTSVAQGSWSTAVEWKLAKFDHVAEAKFIRLYGVQTATNDGSPQKYMSAAEVRVRCVPTGIYSGNTTVNLKEEDQTVDYTGREITPEPVVIYTNSEQEQITLQKDIDYTVTYKNNVEPGRATVIVEGKGNYSGIVETGFTIREKGQEVVESYEPVSVTTARGEYPAFPGTVIANTNFGQRVMEVRWDKVGSAILNTLGTFTTYGTVVDTDARITAEVTVSDVIGVEQVTLTTVQNMAPEFPETVTVYYSNGDVAEREVEWNLEDADFSQIGTVKVSGIAGKAAAMATVRVEAYTADANETPIGKNLALNEDGVDHPTEWPRTFGYVTSEWDPVHNATNGKKTFDSSSSKMIWCDWESGQYHTNADAEVGAADHLPFVVTAFGEDGSTDNADQKKYTVNKVSIGFMEEDIDSVSKVRLPADYKIEYYSANDGVIPADRLVNNSAKECGNTRGWGADNPIKAYEGWTEVTYIGEKPAVPSLENFKQMVDVAFEPVETTAIRITLTPQAENWTGLEEFEVYYEPIQKNRDFEVTSIQIDGAEVLDQFDPDTKELTVEAVGGKITAEATDNASVTVLEAVDGIAKVIFLPENGDESKKQEYTINFATSQEGEAYLVSAEHEFVELEAGLVTPNDTVTFAAREGYTFTEVPVIVRSDNREETQIKVTEQDGMYSFQMPSYPVLITGEVAPVEYQIHYELDGGNVSGNPVTYTVETATFTLKNPTKDGSTFLGWTSESVAEPTTSMKVERGTTGDLTFTANWREGTTYRVTFNSNGGSDVPAQEVETTSGKLKEPEIPSKRGYDFDGWYSDEELSHAWDFENDIVTSDMTLYAKWSEAEITVNTEIPVRYLGQSFEMPEIINITVAGETFDTNVTWNNEELEAVINAEAFGRYPVTGALEALEDRQIQVEVFVSPNNIVYFVDSGADAFTEDGQLLIDANEGVVKNSVPDQAYNEASGWGYTNPDSELEVNGSGDAYSTIRNFNSETTGKTLTYQFSLEEGLYDVTVGFYDPWSEWAGDMRHAKITLVDDQDQELAVYGDYHISGKKDMVQLTDVNLSLAGKVRLNIAPLKTGENSDTMVSFIVIAKKDEAKPIYRVDFESNGGSPVASQNVVSGQKAERPEDPIKEGYSFEGWYQDEALDNPWDFDADTVTENLTLYAKWSEKPEPVEKVTVTYLAGEGGRIEGETEQIIDKGGSTTQVTAVAKEGYTFSRWSDGVTTAQRTDTNVTASKTVTAQFTKNPPVTEPETPGTSQPETPGTTQPETPGISEPEIPKATGVKLNVKKKISIGVKEKVQLKANVLPAGASQKVTWKSSKKSVVAVTANGKITGKKRGTAIITATAENRKKVICRVTVKKAPKKITLKAGSKTKTLKKGKSWTMKVKFPAKSTSYKVTFKSNRKKVATVNANGKIKARKKGMAIITARTYNGKKVNIKILVK